LTNFYYQSKKICLLKILFFLFVIPFLLIPAFSENSQVLPTEKGTLDVDFSTDPLEPNPNEAVKLKIDFINPFTNKIQEHIDYIVTVSKDDKNIFGPIPLTHTSSGSVKIPVQTQDEGLYVALIEVSGILFQPIPPETVSFDFAVGAEGDKGVMVEIETSSAGQGEVVTLDVTFTDMVGGSVENVNYDIIASQGNEVVLDVKGAHEDNGMGSHTTAPLRLAASETMPLNIQVTFNGFGMEEPFTGPIGQVATKQVVPEFGTIAMMILGVSIVSIIAITAKSKIFPKI